MDDLLILFFVGMAIFVFLVVSKPRGKKKRKRKVVHFGDTGNVKWQEPDYEEKVKSKPIKQPVSLDPIVGGCWVVDGDTIHIGKHKIRFQGMNAPELDEPYGQQAKWTLQKLVKGQTITAQPNGETS